MTPDQEAEADLFARCLLMPSTFLLADLKACEGIDLCCDDDQVKRLAKQYGVSMSVMALRIYEVTKWRI